jgi:hypothetical protein
LETNARRRPGDLGGGNCELIDQIMAKTGYDNREPSDFSVGGAIQQAKGRPEVWPSGLGFSSRTAQ